MVMNEINKIQSEKSQLVTEWFESATLDLTTMPVLNSTTKETIKEKRENFIFIVTDEDNFIHNQLLYYLPVILTVIVIMVAILCYLNNKSCGKTNKSSSEMADNTQPSLAITIPGFS